MAIYFRVKKLSLVIIILLISHAVAAAMPMQPGTTFTPNVVESAREMIYSYPSSATLVLPKLNYQEEQKIIDLMNEKNRFYLTIKRNISVSKSNWKLVGSKKSFNIWQLHIKSPGAVAMQALFDNVSIVPGLIIKIYSGQKNITSHIGEHLSDHATTTKNFWSTSVPGDTIVIEVWLPHNNNLEADTFPFEIKSINHYFRDANNDIPTLQNFLSSPQIQHNTCNSINFTCINDGKKAYSAIGLMRHTRNTGFTGQCSGAFIGSTTGTELYFLTAYHCLEPDVLENTPKGSDINAQIQTSFSSCASASDRLVGNDVKFIAASERGDWALLWVNKNSLQRADGRSTTANTPTLLGWDPNSLAVDSTIETLHHGRGFPQNYAKFKTIRSEYARQAYAHNNTFFEPCYGNGCTHYEMEPIVGGIDSGASGSSWWESKTPKNYRVRAVTTNSSNSSCNGSASRFDKAYEDGRVQCALNNGSTYYPQNTSSCNDSARPFYDHGIPQLANLSLTVGDLYPSFNSMATNYIATVDAHLTELTLNFHTTHSSQTITVNDNAATTQVTVVLDSSSNIITIEVAYINTTITKIYTIEVLPISSQNFEPVGRWENTRIKRGSLYCPLFSSLTNYRDVLIPVGSKHDITNTPSGLSFVRSSSTATSIEIDRQEPNRYTFQYTDSYTARISGDQYKVNSVEITTIILTSDEAFLSAGNAIISSVDYPEISCNIGYIIDYGRTTGSSVVLKNILLSAGTLNPTFDDKIKNYTVTVDNDIAQITVEPIANYSGQMITVNGYPVASGNNPIIPLKVGNNTISIRVVSADGKASLNYTIQIMRRPPPPRLTTLFLSDGTLNPNFDSKIMQYTANVASDIENVELNFTANATSHTVVTTVNGNPTTTNIIPLKIGSTEVVITVITANAKEMTTYNMVIKRLDATLTSVTITAPIAAREFTLKPSFSPTISEYRTTIISTVSSVNLIPTAGNERIITVRYRSQNGSTIDEVVASGNAITIPLLDNTNTIYVDVTHDSAMKRYTLIVNLGILVRVKTFLEGALR